MDNDLVTFEFINHKRGPVYLNPVIAWELGTALEQVIEALVAQQAGSAFAGAIRVLLAGTERGSLKLSYKILASPSNAEHAANLATIADLSIKAIFGILLSLQMVGSVREDAPPHIVINNSYVVTGLENTGVVGGLERISTQVDQSGADEVRLHIPDMETVRFTNSHSRDPRFFGHLAKPPNDLTMYKEITGKLSLGGVAPMQVSIDQAGETTLYAGNFALHDGVSIPVAVVWGSKRQVPLDGLAVQISGRLVPFHGQSIKALGPITTTYRNSVAILYVDGQIISE